MFPLGSKSILRTIYLRTGFTFQGMYLVGAEAGSREVTVRGRGTFISLRHGFWHCDASLRGYIFFSKSSRSSVIHTRLVINEFTIIMLPYTVLYFYHCIQCLVHLHSVVFTLQRLQEWYTWLGMCRWIQILLSLKQY